MDWYMYSWKWPVVLGFIALGIAVLGAWLYNPPVENTAMNIAVGWFGIGFGYYNYKTGGHGG